MIKEICIGDYRDIEPAIKAGANRIELNADLPEGGVTPSFGVIDQSVRLGQKYQVPVIVMLRPRGGNFVYTDEEFQIMREDLCQIALLNADGVAFGCLNADGSLDQPKMAQLLKLTSALKLTAVMHMAFDEILKADQQQAIDWLSFNGAERILTHGGVLTKSITETLPNLKEIIAKAGKKITILPGGGINSKNVAEVSRKLGVQQAHGSKIVDFR